MGFGLVIDRTLNTFGKNGTERSTKLGFLPKGLRFFLIFQGTEGQEGCYLGGVRRGQFG